VIFDWTAPDNNGLPISSFTVLIRKADNQFAELLEYCNGAVEPILTNTECTVPLASLIAEPFLLKQADSIDFIVRATNAYGDSEYSQLGGGALIQLVPDAPVNLQDLPAVTTATVIGFEWQNGSNDGGAAVLDYRLYFDQSTDTWSVLAEGVLSKQYITENYLEEGQVYSFKV
jgi:hypothetical protein